MVVKSMSSAAEQVAAAVALTITVTDVAASARGAISSRSRLSFVSVWSTRRTLAPGAGRRLRAAPRGDCGELRAAVVGPMSPPRLGRTNPPPAGRLCRALCHLGAAARQLDATAAPEDAPERSARSAR